MSREHPAPRVLVLACGALARELRAIIALNGFRHVTLDCLPASLHNTPAAIPDAIRSRLAARGQYERILIGYADCGTAGALDQLCEAEGLERLPGAHCYQAYTGVDAFAAIHAADPTAFYLTDFLVRHFDRLVLDGLGISTHPELEAMYFGNYTRVVYLAQTDDDALDARARAAAARLGLAYERMQTGHGQLEATLVDIVRHDHAGV